MKVRNGFVSNSSTSSFVVFGVEFDSEDQLRCAILSLLGKEAPEPKPVLSLEQKKAAVLEKWDNMGEKPIEYYKWKCDETDDSQFASLYESNFGPDEDDEEDLWELIDELYDSEWTAETEYHNVLGYKISHISSDDGIDEEELDLVKIQEKVSQLEEVTGKKAKIISYITAG